MARTSPSMHASSRSPSSCSSRAERRVVALRESEPVESSLVRYLNRLGDLLFVMARWCNHRAGVRETEWTTGGGPAS